MRENREDPSVERLVFNNLCAVASRQAHGHIYLKAITPWIELNAAHRLVFSLGEHIFCTVAISGVNLQVIARYPDYLLAGEHCQPIYGNNSLMYYEAAPPNGIRALPYLSTAYTNDNSRAAFRRGEYVTACSERDIMLRPSYSRWDELNIDLQATNSIEYVTVIMVHIVRTMRQFTMVEECGHIRLRNKAKGKLPDLIGSATAVCSMENAPAILPKYVKHRKALYG